MPSATKRRPRRAETTFFDQRTRAARRFREIVAAYEAEAGGGVTDLDRDVIKQAAALTYRGEELQAAMLRGDPVDNDELVRLSSTAKRLLSTIQAKAERRKPAGPDLLREYLANKAAAAAGASGASDPA